MSEKEPTIEIGGMQGPDNIFYPAEYVANSPLNVDLPNYEIRAIRFRPRSEEYASAGQLENVAQVLDGALFNIHPSRPSHALRITQPGYTAMRQCVEGDGIGLILRADGSVDEYRLGSDAEGSRQIELHQGDLDVWIAGKKGLKILDRSTPPFQLDFEEAVNLENVEESLQLPQEYAQRYRELVEQAEKQGLDRGE